MRKRTKILALLLAGVMVFNPAMEIFAVEGTEYDTVGEFETEEVKAESEIGTEAGTKEAETEVNTETETETIKETTESEMQSKTETTEEEAETNTVAEATEEETASKTEPETTEATEEAGADTGTGTTEEETETRTETGTAEEETETGTETTEEETETETTEEETETGTETTEEETETGTETTEEETETDEAILPGIENYTLDAQQRDLLRELKNQMNTISTIEEGVDCVEGELTFLADSEEEALMIAAGYGGELRDFEYGVGVVTLPEEVGVVEALEYAASSLDTRSVVIAPAWPNYYNYAFTDDVSMWAISTDANDPYLNTNNYYYQWQHATVGSYSAWNAGYTGQGVTVAVLDSGVIPDHEDLRLIDSENCVSRESSPTDGHGHGTHVAGLIAATKNNGKGGAGIAPDADIVNVRVLGSNGSGTAYDIMRGMNYAVSKGVDIINMSLGGYFYSGDYASVVKRAYDNGVALFVAAGNDGSSIATYPACYSGAIAVGATTQGNDRTYFSNYGSWVKYYAPGYNLYSTYKDGRYYMMSGTSQATPVVAGTAAVILSANDSVRAKTGRARVDALVSAMNKGKVNGIVSLPKALGISVSYEKPKAPVFEIKTGTTFNKESESITIRSTSALNKIYYSVDGKNPTFKNGEKSANALEYVGSVSIGGQAKVTVKAIEVNPVGIAGAVASATYNFKPSATSISIEGASTLLVGKNTKFTAAVFPEYAANKQVSWDIDPKDQGVTISDGTVKAAKNAVPGVYKVSAKSSDDTSIARAEVNITVNATASVKKIAFGKTKDTVYIGETPGRYNLVTDSENNPILDVTMADGISKGTNADVIWTSNNTKLATVSDGIVTALKPGTVKITATANDGSGVKAVFTLTIKQYATDITLSGSDVVAVGKSNKLTATVMPAETANKKLKWSVSPEGQGVTVSNGTVKAAKNATAGEYIITATAIDRTDGAAVATKSVTVSDNAIQKITLSRTKATIYRISGVNNVSTSVVLMPVIVAKTASGGSASSALVEFTSSNPGIARVHYNGSTATVTATGNAAGTTKITCKALDGSGKSASCTVTVANPISKVAISPPKGNNGHVAVGCTIKFKANLESQYGKLNTKKVTWSSSDTAIATVNKNGVVKAKQAGKTVIIRATASDGTSGSFRIYTWKKCKKLALSRNLNARNYYITTSQRMNLSYLFDNQQYGYCPYVSVEVKNKDILQVIPDWQYGYVTIAATGKKKGTTTFTIKANDGSGRKATYRLTVR